MKTLEDYILLTGATGLLGQYLLRDLLQEGRKVAVVVRDSKKQTAEQRIEQTMQMWERQAGIPLRRPVCLTGDITQENLALSETDLVWVTENCGSIIHSAASLTFREHDGEPRRTNLVGTQNVVAFCQQTDIRHMHYISTAYVCGHRSDVVMEDQLDVGQEFRNDYERSKFEAEKAVRECDFFDCTTVYRPVVITGDSETGYTSTYHGTYLYMNLARMLASQTEPNENGDRHVPIRWGLTGDERRNITPVEWNSEVICTLFRNVDAHGRTYHMGPDQPVTMREAIGFGTKFFGLTGIEFAGFGKSPPQPLNEFERWIWKSIEIYGEYDFQDPIFDCTNLKKFAPIPCPKIDGEVSRRLLEYAEEDRWGKRKKPELVEAATNVEQFLSSLVQEHGKKADRTLGLDLLGPGGGQWRLELADGVAVDFAPGLPSDGSRDDEIAIDLATLAEIERSPESALQLLAELGGNSAATALANCVSSARSNAEV